MCENFTENSRLEKTIWRHWMFFIKHSNESQQRPKKKKTSIFYKQDFHSIITVPLTKSQVLWADMLIHHK